MRRTTSSPHGRAYVLAACAVTLVACRRVEPPRQSTAASVDASRAGATPPPNIEPESPNSQVPPGPAGGACALVRDGKPNAVIVLADDPTRSAQLAAFELRAYVEKATGAPMKIAREKELSALEAEGELVLVGESERTRKVGLTSSLFRRQEYLLRNVGKWLVLMGRDDEDRGTLDYKGTLFGDTRFDPHSGPQFRALGTVYAVHTWLEREAGVRWYLPGDIGEVVPVTGSLGSRELNVLKRPWTRYRSIGPTTAWDPQDFYIPGRKPTKRVAPRNMILWWLRMKMGGDVWYAGHSMTSYPQRFGDTHPDWFAKRTPKPGAHVCLRNPAVVQQQAQDARDYFDGLITTRFATGGAVPAAGPYFGVAPADSSAGWCDDAGPDGPSPPADVPGADFYNGLSSDYVWGFVNAVARDLHKTNPGRKLSAPAYGRYFLPPSFRLEPDVSVTVSKSVALTTNAKARAYFQGNVRAWGEQTNDLFVWDYLIAQHLAKFASFPWIAPHVIADDVAALQPLGVKGAFVETSPWQSSRANMPEDLLNVYVLARLLADDTQPVDVLLADHYRSFYGAAAAPMAAFFDAIEQNWRTHDDVFPGTANQRAWELFATKEKLLAYRGHIDEAARLAPSEPYATRVAMMREAVLEPMEAQALRLREVVQPRRRITCPALLRAPKIDGRVTQAEWSQASKSEAFAASTLSAARSRTDVRVGHDDTTLYVAAEGTTAKGDGGAEELDIDFAVGRSRKRVHRVKVAADGTATTSTINEAGTREPWDATVRVAAGRTPTSWTVEAAIPLSTLVAAGVPAEVWGFNVSRSSPSQRSLAARTSWVPWFDAHDTPQRLGVLDFGGAKLGRPSLQVTFDDPIDRVQAQTVDNGSQPIKTMSEAAGAPWTAAQRVPGKRGEAYEFKKSERRSLALTVPPSVGIARDDWTLSAWLRPRSASAGFVVVSTTSSPAWNLAIANGKKEPELSFSFGAGAPTVVARGGARTLFDGTWHHVAVSVARDEQAVVYFDGNVAATVDIGAHDDPLKDTLTIGGPYEFYDGTIDDLRIYRGVLGAEQVHALFVGNRSP